MYNWIIQEIIQKEKEKEKIEKERESMDNAVLYIDPPREDENDKEKEEKSERGVVVIDIA